MSLDAKTIVENKATRTNEIKNRVGQLIITAIAECVTSGIEVSANKKATSPYNLPSTIAGRESHFPVFADVRLRRRETRPVKYAMSRLVWNLRKLESPEINEHFVTVRDRLQSACILRQCQRRALVNDRPEILRSEVEVFAKDFARLTIKSANSTIGKIRTSHTRHRSRLQKKYDKLLIKIRFSKTIPWSR